MRKLQLSKITNLEGKIRLQDPNLSVMTQQFTNCGIAPWIVLATTLACSGCATAEVSEVPLWENKVEEIQRGTRTKQDILDLFGPPKAILKREDLLDRVKDKREDESLMAQAIQMFQPFPHTEKIMTSDRIFYYTFTKIQTLPTYVYWIERGEKQAVVSHL